MGVSSSLFSGVSGLNANGNAMSVIGNNIANSNTIGFKASRTIFGDLLSSQVSGSGGTSQVGRGVGLSVVDNIFSQGTFENTELNTDLAVEGPGFFIVSDPSTGNVTNNYTRAGAFRFDGDGYLVNPEGFNLMGYSLDLAGNTFGDLTPVRANTQSFTSAGPTGNVTLNTNLDSDSAAMAPGAFDVTDPTGTSHSASSIRLFDSLGSTHLMSNYFTKVGNNTWEWNSVVDGAEVAGGTAGTLEIIGSGTLGFSASGTLIQSNGTNLYDAAGDLIVPTPAAAVPQTTAGSLNWINGAVTTQQVVFDMQTTQYASPSVVVSQEQDGFGTGSLVKLNIDEDGNVVGNFSNGQPRMLMRLALAKFTNPGAMDKIGSNMWAVSTNSGPAVVGTVGSGVGNIFTNALEQSNVDLAQEFVKMITTQRGFSANSKTITTTDEMLAEVINLKR